MPGGTGLMHLFQRSETQNMWHRLSKPAEQIMNLSKIFQFSLLLFGVLYWVRNHRKSSTKRWHGHELYLHCFFPRDMTRKLP